MPRLPRIPDLLTTANLACGVGSILLASQGQLTWACWLVFAGAVFDVFDGLAARALGQGGSEFGKQLDSLADMVTFGVAPGMLVFMLFHDWNVLTPDLMQPSLEYSATALLGDNSSGGAFGLLNWPIVIAALLIPVFSAWRLAKFNVDTRQTSGFLGLPTPANALFWSAFVLIQFPYDPAETVIEHISMIQPFWARPLSILGIAVILGILMLSELPLPSLKFKHVKWRGNEVIYLLLGIGLVLVVLYGILAIPLILVLYLLSPLWGKLFPKENSASSH